MLECDSYVTELHAYGFLIKYFVIKRVLLVPYPVYNGRERETDREEEEELERRREAGGKGGRKPLSWGLRH